jgi:alpha-mannosidase
VLRHSLALTIALCLAGVGLSIAAPTDVTIKQFLVAPPQAEPGESVGVRLTVADPQKTVAKAVIGVRGFPEIEVELKPVGDNWVAQIDVPAVAPPGVYALDAKLFDAAGQAIAAGGVTSSKLEVLRPGQKSLPQTVARRLTELREILGIPLGDWRWKQGDIAGAEKPGFDDASWATGSPEISWGPENSVAWFRKEVTIPDRIAGFAVAGSPIILLLSVDDDGEVYVNGTLRQKFHWDEGRVTLTESARPGEKLLIAVKGINGPGAGRLMSAELRMASLEDLRREVGAYLGDLAFGQAALQQTLVGGQGLREALAASVAAVNLDALSAGNKQAFLDSLRAARDPLRPVAAVLKNYTVHLVGHAHIDMNWLWLWPETVEVCRATFSQALDFMGEQPEFTFSQSQASTYLAMEQNYPDIFADIGRRVKEGRWEVTGGTWVEGDMNMASGEAIARQILYAKRYFRDKFGVDVRIAWEPDTFGHAWTVPQILKKSGIDYYYFVRCGKDIPLFWWEAPDGSRVLAYNFGDYSGGVDPGIGNQPLEFARAFGVKDALHVYGVGDHGGGPTRADIESALELQRRLIFPRVKFSTAQGYFDKVLSQTTEFPVVRDELNFTFRGCYTTHADIKRWNRISENLLPTAEAFSALAAAYGRAYPRDDFTAAWRNTCFNQFHDIFDGSAIHGSYEYSRGLFEQAYKVGSEALAGALGAIAARVDTRGGGAAVVVFNPMAWDRIDTVAAAVDLPAGTAQVRVTDDRGKQVQAQTAGRDATSGKLSVTFIAEAPSLGYRVFHIEPAPAGRKYDGGAEADDGGRLENEFWRVQVDPANGAITSIYDKRRKLELVPGGERANLLQALFEKPHGMSAWEIGEISRTENLDGPAEVRVAQRGPAAAAIRVTRKWRASTFTQDITLYAGLERIDFITTADWREIGTAQADFPMIKVAFPAALARGEATFEIPFGSIVRPADGNEVPALKWIDLTGIAAGGKQYGVSLLNDSKYGHDINGNVMRLTLLRCPYEPDPRPDEGEHHFTYSLYPHPGGWREAATARRGYELNNPLIAVAEAAHRGTLGASHSFLRLEPDNLVLTACKRAEDSDDLILHFYDFGGVPTRARVIPGFGWAKAAEVNLMEAPTGAPIDVDKPEIRLDVAPFEVKALRLAAKS